MSEPIELPAGEKVQLITLPVTADVMELLEITRDYVAKAEGLQFESVGEFLSWQLFDGGSGDGIKAIVGKYKRTNR
tara:strand:+ start:5336 stop:5563 length:228 start_codon:yes stop_codon:yes gene_type:complete